jgi:gamma-glutamylcyclotransferase (GGCT)/AIG2-like uncharacterized protein YtfP
MQQYGETEGPDKAEELILLGVYGTMRRGGFNYSLIEDCTHIGVGVANGLALYIDFQRPVARLLANYATVVELYLVPRARLALIDAYEGAASPRDPESTGVCDRRRLVIELHSLTPEGNKKYKSQSDLAAEVYIYRHRTSDRTRIRHGDFIRYLRECGELENDLPL